MLGALLLAIAVVTVHGAQLTTNVLPCSFFPGPLPVDVHLEGCVHMPCEVNMGQDVALTLIFQAPRATTTMRSLATAFLIPTLPLTLPAGRAEQTCNSLTNSLCPVPEGAVLRSRTVVKLPTVLPVITFPVELRVLGDDDTPFVCLRLHVAIRAGNFTAV